MSDPTKFKLRTHLKLGGYLGFIGGFLLAYQRSSCKCHFVCLSGKSDHTRPFQVRFWGWAENKREEERDFKELSARAQQGLPLYGESHQPEWVQAAAYRNSAFSQLKFGAFVIPYVSSLVLTSIA